MNAIQALSYSLVKAVTSDLDGIKIPGRRTELRPADYNCRVIMFSQTWSSGALGFGGAGGQAITPAYTVIVISPQDDACVYFAGRLAYHINRPNDLFYEHIKIQTMNAVSSHHKYEKAE